MCCLQLQNKVSVFSETSRRERTWRPKGKSHLHILWILDKIQTLVKVAHWPGSPQVWNIQLWNVRLFNRFQEEPDVAHGWKAQRCSVLSVLFWWLWVQVNSLEPVQFSSPNCFSGPTIALVWSSTSGWSTLGWNPPFTPVGNVTTRVQANQW